jgi:hypothetical protein
VAESALADVLDTVRRKLDGVSSRLKEIDRILAAPKEGKTFTDAAKDGAKIAAIIVGLGESIKGEKPRNFTPDGAGRDGAFNEAKRLNGIPTSQQPDRVSENRDARGNLQPGRTYEFDVPRPGGGTQTIPIRDDAAGHKYPDNPGQDRGPHFNDPSGRHFDY